MLGGGTVARWDLVALLGALLALGGYSWILDRRNGTLKLQAASDARSITALEASRAQARLETDVAAARTRGGGCDARPGDGRHRAEPKLVIGGVRRCAD